LIGNISAAREAGAAESFLGAEIWQKIQKREKWPRESTRVDWSCPRSGLGVILDRSICMYKF